MKVKGIEYRELRSRGYDNAAIGVVIELDKEDSSAEAIDTAREWVNAAFRRIECTPKELKKAQKLIDDFKKLPLN